MYLLAVCETASCAHHFASFSGTLVSGFLASLARTPVGSFLLASLSLWPFSEVHLSAIQ